MLRILQDCITGKFLRVDSTWTCNLNEANEFLSLTQAIGFGVRELKGAFRVVEIEDDQYRRPFGIMPPSAPNQRVDLSGRNTFPFFESATNETLMAFIGSGAGGIPSTAVNSSAAADQR